MMEKVIKFLQFLFPYGNYRYYALFIPSLFVLGTSSMTILYTILFLHYGWVVSTDSFTAQMPLITSHRVSDFTMSVIGNLFEVFGYLWWTMVAHTVLSLIADFIVRPILFIIDLIRSLHGSNRN